MHCSWPVHLWRGSVTAGILWLAACSPKDERSGVNAGSTSALADATTPLSDAAVRNTEYRVDLGAEKRVKLVDGKFYDSTSHLSVTLLQTLPGDLDGDHAEDAVVLLGSSAGASGTFSHLVPVLNRGGQAAPGAATLLGDRILLQAISLADRIVTVEMISQGPRDPMCCPTQPVRQRYRLERDSLVMLP